MIDDILFFGKIDFNNTEAMFLNVSGQEHHRGPWIAMKNWADWARAHTAWSSNAETATRAK